MILENIPKDSPAYKEELFGPVLSFFKFRDDKEAIDLANDHVYGLGSAIFTKNIKKAKEKALQLEYGSVFINDFTVSDSAIPNGGTKDSGYGRECFKDGLLEVCNKKSIVIGKL